ncbi:MAG: putative oxidoreductase, partial [Marivirga sp.]
SAAASLLHVAILFGGPQWYRFFGAGEGMAQLAENGSNSPLIVTMAIAIVLAIWAMYAFSGAGYIKQLPLLKPILLAIAIIYIMRGVLGIPLVFYIEDPYLNELQEKLTFMIVSSSISFGIGILYFVGWKQLFKHPTQENQLKNKGQ